MSQNNYNDDHKKEEEKLEEGEEDGDCVTTEGDYVECKDFYANIEIEPE